MARANAPAAPSALRGQTCSRIPGLRAAHTLGFPAVSLPRRLPGEPHRRPRAERGNPGKLPRRSAGDRTAAGAGTHTTAPARRDTRFLAGSSPSLRGIPGTPLRARTLTHTHTHTHNTREDTSPRCPGAQAAATHSRVCRSERLAESGAARRGDCGGAGVVGSRLGRQLQSSGGEIRE